MSYSGSEPVIPESPSGTVFAANPVTQMVRRRVIGLRNQVTVFFALGALLLSLVLSLSTYVVVRHTLIDQRESVAADQAYKNAALLRPGLRATVDENNEPIESTVDVPNLLTRLQTPVGTNAVVLYNDQWFATSLEVGQGTLPEALQKTVLEGTPASMRFESEGQSYLAIGVPIPSVGAYYFDVSELTELDASLRTLSATLLIVTLITVFSGAALGRWATRAVLRPVGLAAGAAEEIAGGNRAARLQTTGDADLDKLSLSFNRMVDALQGRIERDARFASDVSHELRSPLMTLASGLAVLQTRRHELPERSQTALDLLAEEITRFQRMVQDLLEISRTDSGAQDIHLDEVLAGEFVERVVEAYEHEIPVKGDVDAMNAILTVDKRRMERVVGNLIENADRYAGGVIEISLHELGEDKLQIWVDDNGPGVPLEERQRIFERFARGETARARASGEGTGLGLSLVYEHVMLHKGQVWVEGRPEGGARFIVQLPKESL